MSAIARNIRPSRLLSSSHHKRALHLVGAWGFRKLLSITGCPVEFRFDPEPRISVAGILFEYDVQRAGDVLSMDADGPWEPFDTAFVIERLRPGGAFYDIGANVGWYSLNVALRTPASVVCFEPQPERLFKNLALNSVTSRVFSVALGSRNGTVRMTREHKAANYISEEGVIEVPLKTLDTLVQEEMLDPPTLIKMDVEGFEYEVLRGAIQTLLKHKPLILCEVNGLGERRFGIRDHMLVELLTELGYQRLESNCSNWVFATHL